MAGNTGTSGRSNFEGQSHRALYGMVAGGNHMEIGLMGTSLVDAGKEIDRIATELKAHIDQVQWEGDGADAFRQWGHDTVKESHKLGRFTQNTGDAIVEAAGALGQAKLMPKPKQDNYVELDGGAPGASGPKNGVTAPSLMKDPEREEAVAEMNRLASYYRTAQEKIERQEPPNFRPASGFVPEAEEWGKRRADYALESSTKSGHEQPAGSTRSNSSSVESAGRQYGGSPRSIISDVPQDRQVGTAIDSTAPAVLPDASPSYKISTPPQPDGPGAPPPTAMPGGLPVPGGVEAPTTSRDVVRGQQPVTSRPSITPARPSWPVDDGITGGTAQPQQRGGGSTVRPRLPGGTVIGEQPGVIPPRATGPATKLPAAWNGTAPGSPETAGRHLAVPPGGSVDSRRGPVGGEERGPMRHGVTGGGHPGGVATGGREGAPRVPGRRLAFEPGSTMGTATPPTGVGHSAMPTPSGRSREFTPGGSGLTRGSTPNGVLPAAGGAASGARRRTPAQRPGYLREDEETWAADHPPVLPPVIE